MERIAIKLYSAVQAHKVFLDTWLKLKPFIVAGHRFTLRIEPENKSRDQEEKYHSMIGEIAKQAQHLGATWDANSWKRLLVAKYCKEIGLNAGRVIPDLDGTGIVQLEFQTRKFSKDQASQFIEWLYAWATENGVELSQ